MSDTAAPGSAGRRILLLAHPRRQEAHDLALQVARELQAADVEVVIPAEDQGLSALHGICAQADPRQPAAGCELVVVLGGDGTILYGAELARGSAVPILGVNLGHVGFLAESEREDLTETVARIVNRDYTVQERMALEVNVWVGGQIVHTSFAVNEVSVEKAARERMLEVTVEIDDRPLSTWGCDGVIVATPTGSTAYAFSAGGPVVWPGVEAMLLVPISAHALFARPLVVGPDSALALEVVPGTAATGVVWCDGRRSADLPTGARVEVCRSQTPVLLARVGDQPFTDRLVAKFDLSVQGWRGAARSALRQGD